MKKLLFIFFLLMFLCFPLESNAIVTNSSYSIKVNIFVKNACEDCEKEKEWLEEYKKESFIDIEYINIDDNKELYDKIKEVLTIKDNEIPLVVIGSNYFGGFNNKIQDELTKAIKSYEEVDSYCDAVLRIRNNENAKECLKINKGVYNQSKGLSVSIKVIVVIISICLIIGVGLIIKKKKLFK